MTDLISIVIFLNNIARCSSSSPKQRHSHRPTSKNSKQLIKRGVSSVQTENNGKPKIIVIRREKSIACQSSLDHQNSPKLTRQNQSVKKQATQQLKKSKSVKDEHLIMKQNLLASLTMPGVQSSQLDANNSSHNSNHHSSTTSGVELSSKNSTNEALADGGSCENIHIRNDNRDR